MLTNKDLRFLMDVIGKDLQIVEENLQDMMQDACPNDNPTPQQRQEVEHRDALLAVDEKLKSMVEWKVTRYRVSREYGGPEEGGWWFDWKDVDPLVPSITVPRDEGIAHMVANDLTDGEASDKKERGDRNRFSVVGSPDYVWYVESEVGENASTERPHYE